MIARGLYTGTRIPIADRDIRQGSEDVRRRGYRLKLKVES